MTPYKIGLFAAAALLLSACKPNRHDSSAEPSSDLFARTSIDQFGLRGTRKIALTFDDGPGQGTQEILKILAQYKISATFFVLGKNAQAYPLQMAQIQKAGHIVASHGFKHQMLTGSRYSGGLPVLQELRKVQGIIKPYLNPQHGLYFRAPGGNWPGGAAKLLNADPEMSSYVGPIYWDIGGQLANGAAADWDCWAHAWSVDQCLAAYLNETFNKGGGVVLLHDITLNTAEMVRRYIPELIRNGYQFVTLDDLSSLDRFRSGPQMAGGRP